MFCKNCGTQIEEGTVCPNCGTAQDSLTNVYNNVLGKNNVMAIAGMVASIASLLMLNGTAAVAGLVLSILGFDQCFKRREGGSAMAVIGIIAAVIVIIVNMILIIKLLGVYSDLTKMFDQLGSFRF